ISAAAISKYESGAVKPSLEVAMDIAHYLNVSLDMLLSTQIKNTLSMEGLNKEQKKIIIRLTELFRIQNAMHTSPFTSEQYEIIGKIVVEFSKSK
ncbi:MAG: helix-turn-helix transcriptional regulator, partial [Lachnospiraceae bacterium]|nr:helix-turn-helix transcriptional regulator [Lachnospiraceae bacterium]